MKAQNFSHLHLHTDASLIDGLGTVNNTVKHAKSLGFDSLAMTDHGNLTNVINFNESCLNNGVKPIIGMEAYVSVEGKRYHITLLADGNEGFNTLVNLNNIAQSNIEIDPIRPTFDISDFKHNNKGLYVLSGCPESPMQVEDWSDARGVATYLIEHFGSRFFIEMMFVNYGLPYHRALKLSKDLSVPIVVTNDVHFARKEDKDLHTRLLKMKAGGFSYNSEHLFITTEDDMVERVTKMDKSFLPYLRKGMKNAYALSQKLNPVKFTAKPKLPEIKNANGKLKKLVKEGFEQKVKAGLVGDVDLYQKRIETELGVIIGSNFSSYFLILHDIVNYAHGNKIWVGKGRGSGAGSLVLYVIGITDVDPIKYNLDFARFLNYKRGDYPDVDVDIESEHRDKVISYASEKWNSTPIATYASYKHKSALIDLGKSFRVDDDVKNEASEFGNESDAFKYICKKYDGFEQMYNTIIGQYRHIGQHAGGVAIVNDEMPMPLIRTSKKDLVLAWTEGEDRELSKVGMVKFDLLGLSSGSVLRRLKEKTGVTPDEPIDNHEVFELFRNGDTLGVFQFGSDGIINFLKEVQPNKFEDLVAINALYRPGPLDSGAAFEYPALKREGKQRSLHPDIDHILKDTYGIVCYQEQFMKVIAWLTDGEMEDADLARKVLTKAAHDNPSWVKKFNKLKDEFYEGATNKGWSKEDSDKVWGEIQTHSRYSFNRSHSVSYGLIAWELAWYKYYYPTEFYACYLTVESHKPDKVKDCMMEVVIKGIDVKAPDINKSTTEYEAGENEIYLPITSVKYISDNSYNKIKDLRPFVSIKDYMERVPKSFIKKRGREGLLALGSFSALDNDSDEALHELLEVDEVKHLNRQQIEKQYLGYVLPNEKFIKQYQRGLDTGWTVGFIDKVDVRTSSRGEKYYKVDMSPNGWFCDFKYTGDSRYVEGDVIAIQVDGKYHQLKEIRSVLV